MRHDDLWHMKPYKHKYALMEFASQARAPDSAGKQPEVPAARAHTHTVPGRARAPGNPPGPRGRTPPLAPPPRVRLPRCAASQRCVQLVCKARTPHAHCMHA